MGASYADRERVFTKSTGEWLNPMQLIRAIKRLGEPNMTVRSLRHFHASVALQTGQNIVVVSKRLGHSNISITSDIYTPTRFPAGRDRPPMRSRRRWRKMSRADKFRDWRRRGDNRRLHSRSVV